MKKFIMSKKTVLSVWFCGLMLVLNACSVKEVRRDCPCALMLDFSGVDTAIVQSVNVLAMSADGIVFNENVRSELFSETYVRYVPKGLLQVSVWSGEDSVLTDDYLVQIPYGKECPPIYLDSFVVEADAESFHRKVDLRKNHCHLTVEMPGREHMPYYLTFRGGVDGYLIGGRPSEGDFSCVAYPSASGGTHVVLPRQVNNSLLLEVDDDSPHMKTFAIGEYLDAGGYDWTAEDLADVTVILDYQVTSVTIAVSGWEKEHSYKVVL